MRKGEKIRFFLAKEWLFCAGLTGLITTSLFLKRLPLYEKKDFRILFLLLVQFVLIKGLENAGFFKNLAAFLHSRKRIHFKLLTATFLLAPFITNDLALLVVCPLALELDLTHPEIFFSLLAVMANAGSALTPTGNPQNLFIYWFYQPSLGKFLETIAPLGLMVALFGLIPPFFLFPRGQSPKGERKRPALTAKLLFPLGLFLAGLALTLGFIPLWCGGILLALSLLTDRRNLKVDYLLLATFFCLFGFTDNLRFILKARLEKPHHVFWLAALLSQFMSNVPATLLLADFTSNWQALLWGVNVGGFGNLIGSLANLIAYRFYLLRQGSTPKFLFWFHLLGYLFFALGAALYFLTAC